MIKICVSKILSDLFKIIIIFQSLPEDIFFLLFLESGREEEGDKEKHRTCNPGTHTGQETKPKTTG